MKICDLLSHNNNPSSHRWTLCEVFAVQHGPGRWGCSGRRRWGETWQTLLCRGAPGGRGWAAVTGAAERTKQNMLGFRAHFSDFRYIPGDSISHKNPTKFIHDQDHDQLFRTSCTFLDILSLYLQTVERDDTKKWRSATKSHWLCE